MKPTSFLLISVLSFAAFQAGPAPAQTAAAPPAAAAPPSGKELSKDCKEEVKKACGRAHGTEMKDCIKSSLDLNKFSPSCKAQLTQSAKPPGG